ncbi:MAG TPA: TolC family protein [Bacteroidota bacterium]|nr:TolC family protein [Bacteroidota bacterium]
MKIFITIAIGLLLSVTAIFAQQSPNLTLQQSVDLALEKNITVIQSQNSVEAAQSRVLAAYGSYLPTLSASGSWNRTQNDQAGTYTTSSFGGTQSFPASFSVTNNFSTRIDLSYVVFDGFGREAVFNAAKASASASEDRSIRARQTITNSVESSYLNVLRLGQLVKVSEENLKRDNRQLERITESNKVGAVALADVYRQQTAVASDELLLIQAQNSFDKAKADHGALIGLDMKTDYQFTDPTISDSISTTELDSTHQHYANLMAINDRAMEARPDYHAAKSDLDAAESNVTDARSGYFPTVSASAGYGMSNNEFSRISDNKNLSWGVNIRWNIFDAFRTNQSLQTAIANKKSAEATLSQTERIITVDVKKASLDLEAAHKQVEVSLKGLISATEDRKIAEERYNLGAGTLLDLLTANAGLVNAQANNINATYNYIVSKRNLEYVIGERTY